jgi:single-strand DNA-binding protein
VAIGGLSEVMANHIKKGDEFGITGRLQIRKWEKDNGEKQYFTEVIVNSFDFPDKKKEQKQEQRYTHDPADPFKSNGQIDIQDDDLPF